MRRFLLWWPFWVGMSLVFVAIVGIWLVERGTEEDKVSAETEEQETRQKAEAAVDTLQALCEAGYRSACRAVREIGPVDAPDEDDEVQQDEIQEPEIQERESQEREQQQREVQEAERQDPESDDPDSDDPETQDGEVDDADPDDPENQDPEVDDPDPNSLLTFDVRNECANPLAPLSSATFAWEATPTTMTLVITC